MFNFLRHVISFWFYKQGSHFMNNAFQLLGYYSRGTTLYSLGELNQSLSDLCYVIAWEIDSRR